MRRPGRWRTIWSDGWPTSLFPPGPSRFHGVHGDAARRNRTAVTSLAASVLVALVGTAGVLAVQTHANGELTQANLKLQAANERVTRTNAELESANERVKERFDLAMEAIKLFHGQVGDDLVLKDDQFKALRDRLLKGAADFYGKLESLLKEQRDRASRVAMGNAYFELGELTAKIGDRIAAREIHQKGLAVRRELASSQAADGLRTVMSPRVCTRRDRCLTKPETKPRRWLISKKRGTCFWVCRQAARALNGVGRSSARCFCGSGACTRARGMLRRRCRPMGGRWRP